MKSGGLRFGCKIEIGFNRHQRKLGASVDGILSALPIADDCLARSKSRSQCSLGEIFRHAARSHFFACHGFDLYPVKR